ncbi:PLP-dependent transferase [Polychaeton citri CBS 116435]|uniref:aromatic-amino-acid transaminase n=1 Tax=Polychaeton citri CBS 116435 TaxID=1314669 RepID=A0A9P4UQW8_9PEZI|nr:PLP-dependent transferase [Polychaeton citri CBS 116435]
MAPHADIQVLAETDTSTFSIPSPLAIENVAKRRAASGKLIAGVAAPADIESFKGKAQHLHKPTAKRWDHRLTHEAQSRTGSSLKGAARFLKTPGLISLGGGLPSSEYFPFGEVDFKLPTIGKYSEEDVRKHGVTVRSGKHDIAEDISAFDISTAFNYGQGHGAAQLLRWIVEHTEIVHDPPYKDWYCTMSIGSTSALDMALRMFAKPGMWMLSEHYTFPSAVETAAPMGVKTAAVGMDESGMRADALDDVLSNWDEAVRGGPKPFLLYTVPTGQNPSGATQSLERRKEIYKVAQKHDLIILEDEPYYFLQMEPYTGLNAPDAPPPASYNDFLKSLVPSFLSLDVDGRVFRMDSFSKVVAPGSRVGWITASQQLIERYRTHADVSTQGPSGVSQLMLFKLLDEHWGHGGYLDWLIHIRMEYTARRNVMLEACDRYLPKEIVSWVPPMAGMFHWMKIDHTKHPSHPSKSIEEIEDEIFHKNIECGVLLMKGSWFCAERDAEITSLFFRATYAAAPFDKIQEAIKRLGESISETFGVKKAETDGSQ